jgi:hypothetical protein
MANQQSEITNTLLLESLFIRTPDNRPISSQYVLYANGFGQGYWSNAPLPQDISTLSSAIASTNIRLGQFSTGQSTINAGFTSTNNALQSTVSSAYGISVSTNNALFIAVDSFYQSSINVMYSTLLGYSTYSTFYADIAAVQSSVNASASSFSTIITSTNINLYDTITRETANNLATTSNALALSFGDYSTFASTLFVTNSSLSTIQAGNNAALISTGSNLTNLISSVNDSLSTYILQNYTSINSTFSTIFSTLNVQSTQIASLQDLSTNIISITDSRATSNISVSQAFQDSTIMSTTSSLQSQIYNNSTNTGNLTSTFQLFSSYTLSSISSLSLQVSSISDSLSSLWFAFDLLSMSSILTDIYTSFSSLENYSSNLIVSTGTSVSTSIGEILSTTFVFNQSIANAFFASNVSSVYASTLSTVIPSTMAFVSSMVSTLYSSLYYDLNSTLQNTVVSSLTSTTFAYLSTISPTITSNVTSTLATQQTLLLSNTSSNAVMDFANFRNFFVNVTSLTNGNVYRLTYQSNALSNINYNRGIITLDISTVGSAYSTNSSLLVLDTNHFGYPTAISEKYIPYISNSDYTMQYEYTILSNIVFTNLLGVYPRLNVTSIAYSTTTGPVFVNNVLNSNFVWRNTPLFVSWTPYSFFPFGTLGGPPFIPQVQIAYSVGSTTIQTYGPFSFSQSTATIQLPAITNASTFISTSLNAYVVGKPTTGASRNFTTILPSFNTLLMKTTNNAVRIGGALLTGFTDNGSSILTLANYSLLVSTSTRSASSNINFGSDSTANFRASNIFDPIGFSSFIGPSSATAGADPSAVAIFSTLTTTYVLSSLVYNTFLPAVSSIISTTAAQFLTLTGVVNAGATSYSRILQLTASTTTSFSL